MFDKFKKALFGNPTEQRCEHARFVLIAEQIAATHGNEFYVEGHLFGRARPKEQITIVYQDGNIAHPVIKDVQLNGDTAQIFFSGKRALKLNWQFALVTNIPYQIEVDVNQPVENPYLLGLVNIFANYREDKDFLNLFLRELARSHYLIAVRTDNVTRADNNIPKGQSGTTTFPAGAKIDIFRITLDNKDTALPVYTDWAALKGMVDQGVDWWKQETMVVGFPQIIDMLSEGEGFIVNPYGPQLFFVNPKIIASIQSSPGYQSEFGKANMQRKVIEKDEQIMLGYPVQNEEVAAICRRLVSFGEAHPEISMIDLLLKSDADGVQSYLVIIDIPEEDCREYFLAIYNTCREVMHKVPYMDFITLKRADFTRSVRVNPPLYCRS